jgi:hypothetical protein
MTYGVSEMVTLNMALRVGPFSLTILILDVWTIFPRFPPWGAKSCDAYAILQAGCLLAARRMIRLPVSPYE